jgi:branched-chain amino acid transport system permease protein
MLRTWRQKATLTDIVVTGIGIFIGIMLLTAFYRAIFVPPYNLKYNYFTWVDLIVKGLALGGVYALIAMGYTLVYGILRMINFAHSEVFMSGPFTAVFLAKWLSNVGYYQKYPFISILLIGLLSAVVSMTVAILLERIAYRPLRNAPRLVPLITAIGASFFLIYTFRGLYGSGVYAYPTIPALQGSWTLFGVFELYKTQVVVIVFAVIMMVILYYIVQKTNIGKAMRAVSEDKEAAALMGIDVDRIIVFTFALGGISAGAAGLLYALQFPVVNAFMGFVPGLKAFTAAVLGGIGSVPGAFLGAMILGVLESLGPNLFLDPLGITNPSQLKDAIAFLILVFILIFRPSGILGERMTQTKV